MQKNNPAQTELFSTDLMKKVAEKAPQKRKILKDFAPEEAQQILDKVEKNKRDLKDAEAKRELEQKQRQLIYTTKKIAKKMEVGNKSKIILFPSYSRSTEELTWYKMGDFSAQYFAYRMADRMGMSVKLRPDSDRFGKMHVITSVKKVDEFVEKAMRLKEFDRHEETLDKIHILYLKKGLTDEEVALLRRTEEIRKEMLHNVIRPKKAAPEVYLAILELGRMVFAMMKRMEGVARIEIGDEMMRNVVRMMDVYYDYTGKLIDGELAQRKLRAYVYRVQSGLAFLADLDAATPTRLLAVGETATKMEELIKEVK